MNNSRTGCTSPLYAYSLTTCGHAAKYGLQKPRVLLFHSVCIFSCFMVASSVVSKKSYMANIAPNSGASSFKILGRSASGLTNLSFLRDYPRHRRGRPTVFREYTFCRILNKESYQVRVFLKRKLHKYCLQKASEKLAT